MFSTKFKFNGLKTLVRKFNNDLKLLKMADLVEVVRHDPKSTVSYNFDSDAAKIKKETDNADSESTKILNKFQISNSKLTFVAHTNPVTGKMDWIVQDENYDYIQEIARSGYGDMLHDKDRNEKYYKAIGQAVKLLKEQNKKVKALDIGTGTGLLSMMASKMGADSISACEAFPPMAKCAMKVLEANGFKDKINLIAKRSTEVSLGNVGLNDIGERANLLITELFDTELIGEGAIGSYTDAHLRLMEEDCVAVPTTGIMYIQAIQSAVLRRCNSIQSIQLPNGVIISAPSSFTNCAGAPLLHDLQVDELQGLVEPITKPVEVFRFDFSHRNALKKNEQVKLSIEAVKDGQVDGFVMWWDLIMDPQGEITLSCAPCWNKLKDSPVPWRDHWMQAVYYPTRQQVVRKGEDFEINCNHDEYSLWFDTVPTQSELPPCTCGLHIAFSRNRIGQINEHERNSLFVQVLQKHISNETVCLVISDGTLLPLIAAALGAKKVFYLDCNVSCRSIVQKLVKHNCLQDKVHVIEKNLDGITAEDLNNLKIDVVIAEPFFQAALLPWENLYFWYALHSLQSHLSQSVVILPQSMTVKAIAVEFQDLQKIRAPVGNCEGFDISEFDRLIEISSRSADDDIEPQPLWEYPAVALSPPTTVAMLDFTSSPEALDKLAYTKELICCRKGTLNGVAFWTEFSFGDGIQLNSGVVDNDWQGEKIRWDMFSRQGVKLYRHGQPFEKEAKVTISAKITPVNGDILFKLDETIM
ncbi:unnamed protein product [Lymnaea stagnalis]|uniref:Protein arginine N-methyltransferase n=1 Tax=Lymnaea stagnalis TaxID=6523 RepID=A0AAV2IFE5_LYMST